VIELAVAGKHLGSRVRELLAVVDRLDSFVFDGPAGSRPTPAAAAERTGVAEAFVVRALRAACDPDGWRIIAAVRDDDVAIGELSSRFGVPRVIVREQVNELIQAGLVSRELESDRVGLTAAGRAVLEIVVELARAAAEEIES
jgi:DNA-binding MarR family transcriptional regulator